jgi:hypothetical protein
MRQNCTSVDQLAADLKTMMRAGERREVEAEIWERLTFDDRRYEARFQALEARLGGGWAVTEDHDRTVIYRRDA